MQLRVAVQLPSTTLITKAAFAHSMALQNPRGSFLDHEVSFPNLILHSTSPSGPKPPITTVGSAWGLEMGGLHAGNPGRATASKQSHRRARALSLILINPYSQLRHRC